MKKTTDIIARRLALTLLAVLTTSLAWAQISGKGTKDEPYLISSAEDWNILTENVNNKISSWASAYYLQTDDITLGTETDHNRGRQCKKRHF